LISSGFGGNWATVDEAKNAPDNRAEFLKSMASNDNDARSNNQKSSDETEDELYQVHVEYAAALFLITL
jgi:hypothetical protein